MIKYRKGYKYQLAQNITYKTNIRPSYEATTEFISLRTNGILIIRSGYAWDGPSGLTIDTKSSITASCVHDALYELIRKGLIRPVERSTADVILAKLCIENGMWKWRAHAWYVAVSKFADFAADPANKKKIHTAP